MTLGLLSGILEFLYNLKATCLVITNLLLPIQHFHSPPSTKDIIYYHTTRSEKLLQPNMLDSTGKKEIRTQVIFSANIGIFQRPGQCFKHFYFGEATPHQSSPKSPSNRRKGSDTIPTSWICGSPLGCPLGIEVTCAINIPQLYAHHIATHGTLHKLQSHHDVKSRSGKIISITLPISYFHICIFPMIHTSLLPPSIVIQTNIHSTISYKPTKGTYDQVQCTYLTCLNPPFLSQL